MNQHARSPIPPVTEADLRLLRIFRAVAEAGGLSAAEEKLGMERSTISRHLQAPETRLGARLCFRGPAGFELTEFGRRALHASIAACEALEAVHQELNLARGILTGELVIGIADNCLSNPQCRMAETLERFRRHAPDVTINLSVGLPDVLVNNVLERRAHLAISGMPLGNTKLAYRPLFSEEFRLYAAAPGCDLADVRERRFVLVMRTNDRRTQTLAERLKIGQRAVAFGLEAVATLIASGGYVGFLPTHYAAILARRYPLVEVTNAETLRYTTQFSLISLIERPLPPSGQLFVRLFTEIERDT